MGKDVPNIPCGLRAITSIPGLPLVLGYEWSVGIQNHTDGQGPLHVSQAPAVLGEQAKVVAEAAQVSIPAMEAAAAAVAPPIAAWLSEVKGDPRCNALPGPPIMEQVQAAMTLWLAHS
jgi:hypothetical protein